jgi:prepilin-type N-terminal cleavage/methylation domain-containing protein
MKNRAFTLLELLVVITIIGILSSIVIVSMSGSTDSATIAKGKAYAQQIHALLGHEAVLDLNFNENAYDTCPNGKDVCDASGYNNNGEIYNDEAVYVSSPIDGHALSFDGVDDYVDAGNGASLDITDAITVEGWVKNDVLTGKNRIILWKWASYDFYITSAGVVTGQIYDGGYYTVTSAAQLSLNNWYHIVFIFDENLTSGNLKIYINGVLDGTPVDFTGAADISAYNVQIGGSTSVGDAYFSGLIDDVRIYSEALPETEIQKHYVQGLGKLLANQAITQSEYGQRMEEFNQYLASNRF